jgi:uncharacterized RDD family membrane protein YckC
LNDEKKACHSCGNEVAATHFCGECGADLTTAVDRQLPQSPKVSAYSAVPPWQDNAAPVFEPPKAPIDDRAGWGYRVGAFLIDAGIASTIFVLALWGSRELGISVESEVWLVPGVLLTSYAFLTVGLMSIYPGQSLGKLVAAVQVVRTNGVPVRGTRAFVRTFVCALFYLVPFGLIIDGLAPLGSQRRSVRDRMAATYVVKKSNYQGRALVLTIATIAAVGAWIGSSFAAGVAGHDDRRDFIAGCEEHGMKRSVCECAWKAFIADVGEQRLDEIRLIGSDDDLPADIERASIRAFNRCA